MLFTSPAFSQASGSLAGIVFSHNRGGMYTRARSTPTDPASTRQQIMRAIMGALAGIWGQTLTPAQRAGWNTYGANVAMTNRLGQTVYLTGQQHFLRSNTARYQAGMGYLPDAPEIYDLGTFTPPTIGGTDATAQDFEVEFTNTDDWAGAATGAMLVFQGKSIGPGRAFYRGPWRYASKQLGAGTPPTSPLTVGAAYPMTEDNLMWLQIRFTQQDGRLSLPVILGPETISVP
jgi:hypothetical protein